MIQTILTIALTTCSAICYRYGGWEGGLRWVREAGVGCCLLLELLTLGLYNFGAVLCLGSVWVESTYFKINGKVYWALVGLSFSISTLPWLLWAYFIDHHSYFISYLTRTIVCVLFTYFWQMYLSNFFANKLKTTTDITDECGRGAIQVCTLPIFLIGV